MTKAFLFKLSAAAAEYKNKGYNYEPDTVVVIKQSTQTVVHISSSLQRFESLSLSIPYYERARILVISKFHRQQLTF
jgi:hypothetical protein